jgi:plasmid stabilization system protein ParE
MKKYNLVIKEEAELEIDSAYNYYESEQENLGERFLDSLDNCFNSITTQPKIFQKVYKKQRQAIVRTFPYVIMYQIFDNEVIVFAVFNTNQDPSKKLKG